jgi:hypothetical protein
MTPAQKIALDWGSNMWTEFLIIACALLDIGCAIYEFSKGDGGDNDNRIVVLTGCILYVYVFETAVRIFAFRLRWAPGVWGIRVWGVCVSLDVSSRGLGFRF